MRGFPAEKSVGTGWGEASGAASPRPGCLLSTDEGSASSTPGNARAGGGGCVEHPLARGARRGGPVGGGAGQRALRVSDPLATGPGPLQRLSETPLHALDSPA